jgi:hypothetical protein
MGLSYTAIETFSVAKNMKHTTHHTYDKYVSNIQNVVVGSSEHWRWLSSGMLCHLV